MRALANRPDLVDFMRSLGAPIPNLEELAQELPPPAANEEPLDEAKAQGDEKETTGETPSTKVGEGDDQLQSPVDRPGEYGP